MLRIVYFTLYYRFKLCTLLNSFKTLSQKGQESGAFISRCLVFQCQSSLVYHCIPSLLKNLGSVKHVTPKNRNLKFDVFNLNKSNSITNFSISSRFNTNKSIIVLANKQPLCTSSYNSSTLSYSSCYQVNHSWAYTSVGSVGPFCLSVVRAKLRLS